MKYLEEVYPERQNIDWCLSGAGGRLIGENCLMGMGFPLRVMKMFGNQTRVGGCTQNCECTNHHLIVHFKMVIL